MGRSVDNTGVMQYTASMNIDLAELRRLYCEEELSGPRCAQILGVSKATAARALVAAGIPRRKSGTPSPNKRRFTWAEPELLYRLHVTEYLTPAQIAAQFGVVPTRVTYWLKRFGFYRNDKPRRYNWDRLFFTRRNLVTAYWAGFLMADGSLIDKGTGVLLTVTLADKDIGHLHSLREALKTEAPVTHSQVRRTAYIGVSDAAHLRESVAYWGIVPRKTYEGRIPEDLEDTLWWHYLRGLSDGDGYVSSSRHGMLRWRLTANHDNAATTADRLRSYGINAGVYTIRQTAASEVNVNGKYAKALCTRMYANSEGLRLERKWMIADHFV